MWLAIIVVVGCVSGALGCSGERGSPVDAGSRPLPPDAGSDASLDAGLVDPGGDAGPLDCAPKPGDGIEIVGPRFLPVDATPVAFDSLCDSLVEAICGAVDACSCGATVAGRCREDVGLQCRSTFGSASVRDDISSGAVTYDARAAGRVVSMLRAGMSSCAAVAPYDLASLLLAARAFRGGLAEWAFCEGHNLACGEGLVCHNIGDFTLACVRGGLPACDALGICQERAPITPHLECAGSACDHGLAPGRTVGEGGRACGWTTRVDGLCGCAVAAGAPCGWDFDCATGYCARGVCTERTSHVGDACVSPSACDAAACIDGTCAPIACLIYR